jgi:hypothetical protein
MKIKDFLSSENQKIDHLSGKDKASALLKSVMNELTTPESIKNISSDYLECFMINADYRSELFVTMQLLEYYIDSGNFNLITMPYPDTNEEKERINEIKENLQRILS